MKKLVTMMMFLGLFAQSALGATALVKLTKQPGYERMPQRVTISVLDDGNVQLETYDYRSEVTTTQNLALINAERVAALKTLVGRVEVGDLVDEQEGEPRCTDAPSHHYTLTQNGEDVPVKTLAGCHEFKSTNYDALYIVTLLDGFRTLSFIK